MISYVNTGMLLVVIAIYTKPQVIRSNRLKIRFLGATVFHKPTFTLGYDGTPVRVDISSSDIDRASISRTEYKDDVNSRVLQNIQHEFDEEQEYVVPETKEYEAKASSFMSVLESTDNLNKVINAKSKDRIWVILSAQGNVVKGILTRLRRLLITWAFRSKT